MRHWNQTSSFPINLCEAGRAIFSDFVPALSPRREERKEVYIMHIDADPQPGLSCLHEG